MPGRFEAGVAAPDSVDAYAAVETAREMGLHLCPDGAVEFFKGVFEQVGFGRMVGPLAHHRRPDVVLLDPARLVLQVLASFQNHLLPPCSFCSSS